MGLPVFDPDKVHQITFDPNHSGLNTTEDTILEQVKENIRRGYPQIQMHPPNPHAALLICGGPSLEITEKELVEEHWRGGRVVAVNGAYQWCIDHNIRPSAAIMLDAREFNARFVETPVEGCKYFLATQCHPRMFDICEGRDVYIWHAFSGGNREVEIVKQYFFERFVAITMGVTVGILGISLLRVLGFTTIHLFGLDSCWLNGKHHVYSQPENDRDGSTTVWLRPRGRDDLVKRFECSAWHVKQAETFMELIKERGELFQLQVHGPGLLAEILRTGASIQLEEKSK